MPKKRERATTSKELTPQKARELVEERSLLQERPHTQKENWPFVNDFYYQAKLYGKIDNLTFRGQPLQDNSLINFGENVKTLCIAGRGWETKEDKNGQIYNYKKYLNNNARIWLHLLSFNIMPSSHSNGITPSQAHLLYQLIKQRLVRLQDVIFASIQEVAIHGRKGARMMFPHLISDLYKKANVRDSGQDLVFQPCAFINVDRLEFAKEVPTRGTQQKKSGKGKHNTKKARVERDWLRR
ncbi:hypothetical protein G2W53_000884 [Senna tora]|uniref:Putative plant transposon protein domain-containing protein n=1 Tax=Senna tora TaxID=362788 RepID=A0A834XGK6_9FABA|nr:hypothetical protein G2W53_000884 [Senna tora]